jgi:hypothetical protein
MSSANCETVHETGIVSGHRVMPFHDNAPAHLYARPKNASAHVQAPLLKASAAANIFATARKKSAVREMGTFLDPFCHARLTS